MKKNILRILETVEKTPLTFATALTAFFSLIILRLTVENGLFFFQAHSFGFIFYEFTHTFLFFLTTFLIFIPLLRYAGKTGFPETINLLLAFFLIILFPPVVDRLIFGNSTYLSFYDFGGMHDLIRYYFGYFDDTPNMGITYGVRFLIAPAVIAIGLYSYLKLKSIGRAVLSSVLAYTALFVLGTLPSWITLLVLGFQKGFLAVSIAHIAGLFLAPQDILAHTLDDFQNVLNIKMSLILAALSFVFGMLTLYRSSPVFFHALRKNSRLPQLVYHAGLLLLGMMLALIFTDASTSPTFFDILAALLLLIAVEAAWLASVVVNDCYDIRIDRETNPHRPLVEHTIPPDTYKTFGVMFFLISLIFSGLASFSAMLLLLGYQAIAWIYSASPLRLKRLPGIATLLAGLAGIFVLLAGFIAVSPAQDFSALPSSILFFLFAAYTLSLPLKDFKDIKGDAADHVYTVPVLLGEAKAKLLLGSLTFLLFTASPFLLNIRSAFFPALLIGSTLFWMIQKASPRSKLDYYRLPGAALFLVTLYGAILAFLLF